MAETVKEPKSGSKTVASLIPSKKYTIVGTVVAVSEKEADSDTGGKFKRNTRIVTLSDVSTRETVDVFISENQWRDYNCEQHLFLGNVVSMTLENNIAGVTGYLEDSTSTVLKAHEKSFNSFNRVVYADDVQLMTLLSQQGVSDGIVALIADSVTKKRAIHERETANKSLAGAPGFNALTL